MNHAIVALASLASLLMLWVGIFVLYHDYCVDSFRQRIFGVRDRMFDDAVARRISFDDAAYGMLRTTMNGFIRYAHRLNIWEFALFTLQVRAIKVEDKFGSKFERNLAQMPAEKQAIYRGYLEEVNLQVVRHLLVNSPLLVCTILFPAFAFTRLKEVLRRPISMLKDTIDEVDRIALTYGARS